MRVATTILLAMGVAGCSRTKANLPPTNPLRAEKDTIRVVGTGDRDDERTVAFKLTNSSEADLTITKVDSSCTCVLVSDFKNITLAAGKAFALEAKVSPPPYGRKFERVAVSHSGSTDKLELSIELVGGEKVPHFPSQLVSADFPALDSTEATQDIFLRTYEPVGKPKWLGEVKCEMPGVVLEYVGHEDRQMNETALRRRYHYRVRWETLPNDLEFQGRLEVAFNYGEQSSSPFGFVSGRLADRDAFSPRTVVLRPGNRESEEVHFSPQFADCELDPKSGVPEELQTLWDTMGDRRVLIIALADEKARTGEKTKVARVPGGKSPPPRPSTIQGEGENGPNSAEPGSKHAANSGESGGGAAHLEKHTITVVNAKGELAEIPVMILP